MRALMVQALRASRCSREQVAERMSASLNEPVSVHQVNAWVAETKANHRFPAEYLAAFCAATGSTELVRDLVQVLGGRMATEEDLRFAELGRLYARRRAAGKKERAMLDLMEAVTADEPFDAAQGRRR